MKIYKNVLSLEFCDSLIGTVKKECVLSSSSCKEDWFIWLIWGEIGSKRLSKDKWNDKIKKLIFDNLDKADLSVDQYELTWLQMAEYEKHRSLRRHVDGGRNQTLIVILSDDFVGGETLVSDKIVELKKGDGVFFYGHNIFHEVKPVTRGVRTSLNFWFN